MIKLFFIFIFSLPIICNAQTSSDNTPTEEGYDLKQYYFVMLKKGDKRGSIKDTTEINRLQTAHLNNINRLAKEGKILVAGPFGDDGDWRGIFIFDSENEADVIADLKSDPMIAAGWLSYEVHPWWTAKNCVFK